MFRRPVVRVHIFLLFVGEVERRVVSRKRRQIKKRLRAVVVGDDVERRVEQIDAHVGNRRHDVDEQLDLVDRERQRRAAARERRVVNDDIDRLHFRSIEQRDHGQLYFGEKLSLRVIML